MRSIDLCIAICISKKDQAPGTLAVDQPNTASDAMIDVQVRTYGDSLPKCCE